MRPVSLRASQEAVVDYDGGRMGVAAVPGSGKTFTLSHLAARLVENLSGTGLADEQEVLIVTFTNPAVNSFRHRIATLVQQERGLLPYIGYRVRTLHGLAHDIVREKPSLVGLSGDFEIVDERVTTTIIRELSESWLRANYRALVPYIYMPDAENDDQVLFKLRRNGPDLIESIAYEVIKFGKDNRYTPADLKTRLDETGLPLPLAEIGVQIYEDYQRSLSYRSAVDFDDLVRLAMMALDAEPGFLERLQHQWPYILEDEAQDSSQLQNTMLTMLSAHGNWVRVGDPNQAIYTTFTTANADFLRDYLKRDDVIERPLPVSGRSSGEIIALANELVRWACEDPLIPHLHSTFLLQWIRPTDAGDPQQNPPDGLVHIDYDDDDPMTPEREIRRVAGSIENWLPDHGDWTVAVLVPENSRGFQLAEELKARGIPYEELLRSTTATRSAAARLQTVLDFMADPTNSRKLAQLYHLWWATNVELPAEERDPAADLHDQVTRLISRLRTTEDYLWPASAGDWVGDLPTKLAVAAGWLEDFREQAQVWLEAGVLPIDQLILTLAQDLFDDAADFALAHKIALVLRGIADNNPDYRLPDLTGELRMIAQNQRRFLGLEDAGTGYEPRPGIVTIATMHAAKGLEWDRVYLMAVNNYSFPSALPGDSFISEKWFVRDNLNLQAEARAQAELMMEGKAEQYREGDASAKARIDYAEERMRLFYVGVTRARRDLIMTWNMGRFWEQGHRNEPSQALRALFNWRTEEAQA